MTSSSIPAKPFKRVEGIHDHPLESRLTVTTYPSGTYELGSVVGPRLGERHPLVAYAEGNGRTRFAYVTARDVMAANMSEATTVTESRMQGAT